MPNRIDDASVEIARILHERLAMARQHHRQSYAELMEAMLEFWEAHYGYGLGLVPPVA